MLGKLWHWFALALPIVVLVGGIVHGERALRHGDTWQFDIGGYDPRDLLRGRYLIFRVEENWGEPHDASRKVAECACLEQVDAADTPTLRPASCAFARESCDAFVTRESLESLDRFYIPEARAPELEARLQEAAARDAARIVVSIDEDGSAAILDLLVDGTPILE